MGSAFFAKIETKILLECKKMRKNNLKVNFFLKNICVCQKFIVILRRFLNL